MARGVTGEETGIPLYRFTLSGAVSYDVPSFNGTRKPQPKPASQGMTKPSSHPRSRGTVPDRRPYDMATSVMLPLNDKEGSTQC